MSFDPVSAALDIGGKLIDKLWPDPAQADEAKLKLFALNQSGELAKLTAETDMAKAAASIVEAEAKSEGWLTRSWRPITMLIFVALITARMLGYTSGSVTEAEYLKLWDIVQLGLGGYVLTRGGMQIVQAAAPILSGMKK